MSARRSSVTCVASCRQRRLSGQGSGAGGGGGALAANTRNLSEVLRAMRGLSGLVLTGSVFEANEGAEDRLVARLLALWVVEGTDR
jgi:hypothetical protein